MMELNEILTDKEVNEATEEVLSSNSAACFAMFMIGFGGTIAVAVVTTTVYKYAVKPIIRKIKSRKKRKEIETTLFDTDTGAYEIFDESEKLEQVDN